MIEKVKVAYHTQSWITYITQIVEIYSKSYHNTIKTSPSEAIYSNNEYDKAIIQRIRNANKKKIDFKIGDKVRILLHKKQFEKGTKPIFSNEIHTIVQILDYCIYVNGRVSFYKSNEHLKVTKTE